MNNYTHILVAVDFSSSADQVLTKARDIAQRNNARLSLLHVVEYMPPVDYGNDALISDWVIDDSEMHQELMSLALQTIGLKDIETAVSGEEGVDKFKETPYDLVVVDTLLPKMDGFEVCQALRALGGTAVKIVLLTGVVDAVDAVKAKDVGVDDYCVKTDDFHPFVKAVENVFSDS